MPKVGDIRGLKKLPKPNGFFTWYWAVSQLTGGDDDFRPRTARLWHGKGEPTPDELAKVKSTAARLCQDLEDWRFRNRGRQKNYRPGKTRSPRGFIYFVRAGERVKIGFSINVKRRVSQLQTLFPEPLDLMAAVPGSMLMERELHRLFYAERITHEWFLLSPKIVSFSEKLRDAAARGEAWKLFPSEAAPGHENMSAPKFSESP